MPSPMSKPEHTLINMPLEQIQLVAMRLNCFSDRQENETTIMYQTRLIGEVREHSSTMTLAVAIREVEEGAICPHGNLWDSCPDCSH